MGEGADESQTVLFGKTVRKTRCVPRTGGFDHRNWQFIRVIKQKKVGFRKIGTIIEYMKRGRWNILVFLILLTSWFRLESVTYSSRFVAHTTTDGLSYPLVRALLQDRTGYIWVGTDLGLNRFDGYRFTVFQQDPDDSRSLSHPSITALIEDESGTLWVGTQGGINRYDADRMTFLHYFTEPDDGRFQGSDSINALELDERGRIWAATQSGVLVLDPGTAGFTRVPMKDKTGNGSFEMPCTTLHRMGNTVWVGTLNGLYRTKTDAPGLAYVPGQEKGRIGQQVLSIGSDARNRLWIGTLEGLFRVDAPDGESLAQVTPYRHREDDAATLGSNHITSIARDQNGLDMWVGSNIGGFHRYDAAADRFERFQFQNQSGMQISVDDIRCLLQDRSGILWVGTNLGLNKHIPLKSGFTHHFRIPGQTSPGALFHNVHSFSQDELGGIWIGGRGMGVCRLPSDDGASVYLTHQPQDPNSLSSKEVRKVLADGEGTLWVGTYGSGLNRVRFRGPGFTDPLVRRYSRQQGDLIGDVVNDLFIDHRGQLWVGTRSGLGIYDPTVDRFVSPVNLPEGGDNLDRIGIYTFLEDRKKRLWIGTLGDGIYRLDPVPGSPGYRLDHIRKSPQSGRGLSCNQILAFHEDEVGVIWIGTLTGGITRFDPRTGGFTHLTEKHGLASNMVYGILEDDGHDFWMSTSRGISWFRRKSNDLITFTEADGLPSDDFNGGAFFKSREGEFFFGGGVGFISFFPSRIRTTERDAPRVVLTDLSIMNRPVPIGPMPDGRILLNQALDRTREIILNRKDTLLTIGFGALDYTRPAKGRYAYRMAGLDPGWNDVQNRRSVTYTYLPPGSYTFMVKGSRGDGSWGDEYTSLRVVMKPEFWETVWFKGGVALFFLSLFLLAYRLRTWSLHKRKVILEHQVRVRTRELKASNEALSRVNQELEILSMAASETDNAISIHAPDGRIEWVNQGFTRLFGWTREELVERFGPNLRSQSFCQHIDAYVDTCLREKRSVVYEVLNETKSGDQVWTQTTMTPILNEAGEVQKLVTVETDITRLKKAEEKAERANQAKSEFLARMSHEIRTPLNGIMGFADLLRDLNLSDVQQEYLEVIQRSGGMLLDLINDVLDLSKIEAGEMKLEEMSFDPELVAYEVCELMMPKVQENAVEIICDVGTRVPARIKGDPVRFRQVLINLMGNAVKFTDQGDVVLSLQVVEKRGGRLKLVCTVTDSGIGLDPRKRELIFHEFQQADGSTARRYGGSGLGLSIARRFARLMGGDIEAGSRPDGLGGSQFQFTAWFSLDEEPMTPEPPARPVLPAGKKILVADDNPRNLTIVQRMLQAMSAQVTVCSHGDQVMPMVEQEAKTGKPFELIILDIDMPGHGGIELAQEIRRLSGVSGQVPLLAFSSTSQKGMAYFKEQGFNGYLTKPVRQERLLSVISHVLGESGGSISSGKGAFLISDFPGEGYKQTTRILVVEDNPINLKLIHYMLEKAGYQFVLAEDGFRALQLLELDDRGFDIIFMDVQMPGMDGCEATRRIRSQGISTPIVAMTAASMPQDREKCLNAGMNEYLSKPIRRSDVYDMIKRFCLQTQPSGK